jgi:Domain of unknown function (DUF397)
VNESPTTPLAWFKSSASGATGCVEVAMGRDAIHVRDSKAPAAGSLTFTPAEWRAFLLGVRQDEFDLPE